MIGPDSPCATNTLGRYDELFDVGYVDFFNKAMKGIPQSHQIPFELYRGNPALYAIPRWNDPGPAVGRKYTKLCDVSGGETIECHVYEPSGKGPHPVYINFHGGGFVGGQAGMDEPFLRLLVSQLEIVVVDVDYRLAPEYPAPIPGDDAYAALNLVIKDAVELNIDPNRIIIGGISAGANLAATTALKARNAGIKLLFQLLVVPVVDADIFKCDGTIPSDTPYPSWIEMEDNPVLSSERMSWFYNHYLGVEGSESRSMAKSSTISPIRANLSALPPTFIAVAEMDILRDEGKAYAEKLKASGVKTQFECYKKMPHTFLLYASILSEAKRLQDDILAAFRTVLK